MRRLILIIALLAVSVTARAQDPDSTAFVNADWKITKLERGAEAMYASIPMFNSVQSICVIKYPAKKFRTEILLGRKSRPAFRSHLLEFQLKLINYDFISGIVLNILKTKDNVLVVFHDDNLYRMTGKDIDIQKVNYSEIKDIHIIDENGKEILPCIYKDLKYNEGMFCVKTKKLYGVISVR